MTSDRTSSRLRVLIDLAQRELGEGVDYFVSAPDASLDIFRARLKKIARERGVVVALGHETTRRRLANRLSRSTAPG